MKKFKIRYGDIIEKYEKKDFDAMVITTNGYVKKDGRAVLGKGIAHTVQSIYPSLAKKLGKKLTKKGNKVHCFKFKTKNGIRNIVTLPVKPINIVAKKTNNNHIIKRKRDDFKAGDIVPGFLAKANIRTIEKSLRDLVKLADKKKWKHVILPRPGCGAGELKWKEVRVLCSQILDKRFHVFTFKSSNKSILIMPYKNASKIADKAIDLDIRVITSDKKIKKYLKSQGYENVLFLQKVKITKKVLKKHKIRIMQHVFGNKIDKRKVNKLLKKKLKKH